MARGRRIRRAPRSYDDSRNSGSSAERTSLGGVAAGELLENIVTDVMQIRESTSFRGVVDVQLELNNTKVDSSGFIVSLFSGSEAKTASVSIKLATRVHLDDAPEGE